MVSNSRTRQSELLLHLVASVKTLGKSENGEGILPKEEAAARTYPQRPERNRERSGWCLRKH